MVVLHKELPILGKLSLLASKAALASHLQGKYKTLHAKLMEKKFQDLAQIFLLAKESGLNIEQLKKDMNSQKIQDTILKTRKNLFIILPQLLLPILRFLADQELKHS